MYIEKQNYICQKNLFHSEQKRKPIQKEMSSVDDIEKRKLIQKDMSSVSSVDDFK